jgi:hypothetical protein
VCDSALDATLGQGPVGVEDEAALSLNGLNQQDLMKWKEGSGSPKENLSSLVTGDR